MMQSGRAMSGTNNAILDVRQVHRGRALNACPDGTFYVSRNLRIDRTTDEGRTWEFVAALPRPFTRRLAESSRLACRLLRHEVRSMAVLSDGTYVAANRHWVYHWFKTEA